MLDVDMNAVQYLIIIIEMGNVKKLSMLIFCKIIHTRPPLRIPKASLHFAEVHVHVCARGGKYWVVSINYKFIFKIVCSWGRLIV